MTRAILSGLLVFLSIALLPFCSVVSSAADTEKGEPHSKVVLLDAQGKDYLQILAGPPETVTMKSGLVVLAHGKSVGKHSTGKHEEVLVVLSGKGEMTFGDGSTLPVEANHALYCPPKTEHNVTNTGTDELRYVYIVAETK
ncbi:MAG TPA: cupin domain-containing protein [Candidatus Binatia bacterium]|nr:cupin domain-containing protein [Candidatus Binatia bacterium]